LGPTGEVGPTGPTGPSISPDTLFSQINTIGGFSLDTVYTNSTGKPAFVTVETFINYQKNVVGGSGSATVLLKFGPTAENLGNADTLIGVPNDTNVIVNGILQGIIPANWVYKVETQPAFVTLVSSNFNLRVLS
jgi:hypothetical protein